MDLKVSLPAGKYIIAVSGGVDSVVLLDSLSNVYTSLSNVQLIVAHFDHGIREDSAKDSDFVKELAKKYSLQIEIGQGELGAEASEADARSKRYAFLKNVQHKYKANAIITAHHQDDVIETSVINILRGTGRRGLSSLKTRDGLIRPLLHVPKTEIIDYAKKHNLKWHEDSTNSDTKYLRNKVRHEIIPKLSPKDRTSWLSILQKADTLNEKIDNELNGLLRRGLHKGQMVLNRKWFAMLPHDVSKEVILTILYKCGASEVDKKTVERLCVQIKTLPGGKILQATDIDIELTKRSARFKSRNCIQKEV